MDIELVIKIPEEKLNIIKNKMYCGVYDADLYKAIEDGIPLLDTRWIPVSERLPEIHNYMQEYIVTIKGNFIRTAFFTESNGKSWWSIDNVTAWMPLPEPYEAESEEV